MPQKQCKVATNTGYFILLVEVRLSRLGETQDENFRLAALSIGTLAAAAAIFWILSRAKQMDAATLERLTKEAAA